MSRLALAVGAFVAALVAAGFILAGWWDATGQVTVPGAHAFWSLPRQLRVGIELVLGVPLAIGAALYFITQTAEFLWTLSWPLRKLTQLGPGRET
jgi:hypothetical protein